MIKGKTKIELFDAATGTKEKEYVEENLVTNATKYLLAFMNKINRQPSNEVFPIAKKALGGIMLFDSNIEEDPENIDFPSNANLVGYADRTTNTSDAMRGSLNSLETVDTDTGFVSVWDFGTSQANGEIKCICLTSAYAGANPFRNFMDNDFHVDLAYRNYPTRQTEYYPFMYRDGYLYFKRETAIWRAKYDPFKIGSVHNDTGLGNLVMEEISDVSDIDFTSDAYMLDGDDGYLYFIHFHHPWYGYSTEYRYSNYEYNNDHNEVTTLSVWKVNYADGSWKVSTEEVVELPNTNLASIDNEGAYCISQGYLYWQSYDGTGIYIINLHNWADVKLVHVGREGESQIRVNRSLRPVLAGDGVGFYYIYRVNNTDYTRVGFIFSDGSMSMSSETGGRSCDWAKTFPAAKLTMVSPNDTVSYHYGYEGIRLMAAYLGTINNLSSPVSKNSSQTMKITYTLTDEQEVNQEQAGEE